jgi:hypothetical protein
MTHEERAKVAAVARGWFINKDGHFATNIGTDVEDVVASISPTDPGAWGMLCDMEGIEVADVTTGGNQ